MIVGRCGLVCSECTHFINERCNGCDPMNQSDPRYINGPCRIWICAVARGVQSCELSCDDYPCPTCNHGIVNCPWMTLLGDT
ncbi:MAG: DUF3795 domain-containing protein [Candidatus Hydrothermarchaeaceae archaeon]